MPNHHVSASVDICIQSVFSHYSGSVSGSYQRPAPAPPTTPLPWTPQFLLTSSTKPSTTHHLFFSPLDDSWVNNKHCIQPSWHRRLPQTAVSRCILTEVPVSRSTLSMTPPPAPLQVGFLLDNYGDSAPAAWPIAPGTSL